MIKLKIKELAKMRGISLNQLADKICISRVAMSYIVNGRNFPTASNLECIAKELNVNVGDLFAKDFEQPDFYASVFTKGKLYIANSPDELKAIVKNL